MGKKQPKWTPPPEDSIVDESPQKETAQATAWAPPETDEVIPVKKKDDPESQKETPSQDGGEDSVKPAEPLEKPIIRDPHMDPLGIGETIVKQLYQGFGDQVPKSIAQTKEVLTSALQASNMEEYIKRRKSVDFQRYVREKEGMSWYNLFHMDEMLPKYKDQYIKDRGLEKTQENIAKRTPEIVERRLETEKYVQQQNKEAAETMGDIPQSYKDVKGVKGAIQYAVNSGTQGLWQIPLVIASKGLSGGMMEAAEVYDNQLDKLAEKHGITREEVIKQNLDKPAEGQMYAVAAAALDRAGAGGVMEILKKGGSKLLKAALGVAGETLTEPAQGALEEIGGAAGAGESQTEALKDAFTKNISKRIDEAAGGFFGAGMMTGISPAEKAKPASEVVSEQAITVPSSTDTNAAAKAADVIQDKVNQATDEPARTESVREEAAKNPQSEQPVIQVDTPVSQKSTSPVGSDVSGQRSNTETNQPAQPETDQATSEEKTEEDLTEVDQKSGEIIPRLSKETNAEIDPSVSEIKNTLLKSGKIITNDKGEIKEVKQNSGYPSQLFSDLEQITGNKKEALNEYLKIKDDNGEFKSKFGDWENAIMKQYGREGGEYSVKKSKPDSSDPSFAWTGEDAKGNPVVTFNESQIGRDKDFGYVKSHYKEQEVTPENSPEYDKLYDQTIKKVRDLKLHLIHQAIIKKQKGQVSTEDNIKSLREIQRLNDIPLAKDYYGEPMIMMHSGAEGITKFLKPGDKGYDAQDIMTGGAGIYFTRSPRGAKMYSRFSDQGPAKGKDIYYTLLKTKNPYYMTDPKARKDYKLDNESSETLSKNDVKQLKKRGYDSVIWDKEGTPKREVVVFDPDQVEIIGSYKNGLNESNKKATEETSPPQDDSKNELAGKTVERTVDAGVSQSLPDSGEPAATGATDQPNGKEPSPNSITPSKGDRATVVKLQEQSTLPNGLKESIGDFKEYETRKQSKTQLEARETIKKLGQDEALRSATSFKTGRTQEQKIALLSELADQFSTQFRNADKEGDAQASQAAYSKFMQSMDTLTSYITDTAQALSYMNLVGQMFETKTGAIKFAKNQIEQSREGALKNYATLKENAQQILKEKAAMEEEIRRRVEEKVQQTVGDRVAKAKLISTEQRKTIANAFDKLKVDTKNNKALSSVIPGITLLPHIWNGSIEVMKQAVLTGSDVVNAVQAGIDYIKSQTKESFDEQKFRDHFNPLVDSIISDKKKNVEKIINKYLPKESPKKTAQKKEFYDKVIELSDAGALSDQSMDDQLAKIFDLPAMTPEIASKVSDMVEDINKAPAGRFKNIAITKLTDYIAQQQKFSLTNYIIASYKAGIFSGIDTQAMNVMGNFFNVLELGFMLGLKNPVRAAKFYKAIANPNSISRATKEAAQVLKTGFDPRAAGDNRRALEQTPRSFFGFGKGLKGAKQLLDPTLEQQKKFVFRALSAGDLLFSNTINDALQNEMFIRQAKEKGLKGKEASLYIKEQMGYTPENIQKAGEVATQEAKDGSIPNDKRSITLRTYELIEQQRDPDVVEKSRAYASDQIMTNTPKGYIGELARSLNGAISRIPILNAFIPVVNFAANAMSRAVQYMPHTALLRELMHDFTKAKQGQSWKSIYVEKINQLKSGDFETEMRLRRAASGVIAMTTLMILLSDDDEDENLLSKLLGKKIKIHGFGPGTQFNRQKNYQLQESGWVPYSFQIGNKYIPYKNYPALNVLLSSMGDWNDAKRYKKMTTKNADERFIFALGGSFKVIAEMGFLTSLNNLMESALNPTAKNLIDIPVKPISGFLYPKFHRNLINLFDSNIYGGGDVDDLVTRSMPVISAYTNEPLVNALGEPIEKNWWDRVELWKEKGYSDYAPIWKANQEKGYFFPAPTKSSLEQKFDRKLTSAEYNQYYKLRGEEIVREWTPELSKLSQEKYAAKMDKITQFADYKALVKMGVMKSDIMKEIDYRLSGVNSIGKSIKVDF